MAGAVAAERSEKAACPIPGALARGGNRPSEGGEADSGVLRAWPPRSAYLHIPFCHRRCFYCDFAVVPLGDRASGAVGDPGSASIEAYLSLLLEEIAAAPDGPPLSTVYVGGGTPSMLTAEQLGRLLPRGFVAALPFERLTHCPRYLKAALLRLEKYRDDPARDARAMSELRPLQTQWLRAVAASHSSRAGAGGGIDPQLEQFGWMLEELRVQLFAQTLRTPVPVSAKRLQKLWESLQR